MFLCSFNVDVLIH